MIDEKLLNLIRKDFPALNNIKNNKPPIYFDNACTTLTPEPVIESINEYYSSFPGCGARRSRHWFADEVYSRIEGDTKNSKGSRAIIKNFINADSVNEIIFTQNATHGINIVALGFKFNPGDTVVLTDIEHNSNLLPWQSLKKKGTIKIKFTQSDENGEFDFESYKSILKKNKVKLVSMAYTSNLTGYTIPAKEIIKLAHNHGAKVLLDAAQTAPHIPINVRELDTDFLVFSLHKICGPRGVGILYGKRELLGKTPHEEDDSNDIITPSFLGGGTVGDTTYDDYFLLDPPERFESGIQNYPGQIASGTAIEYIQKIGINNISKHVKSLNKYLTEQLLQAYGDTGWFRIFGPSDPEKRGGILSFYIKCPNAPGISEDLSERSNIMIRDGGFCVHSFINKKFGQGWMRPNLPSEHKMTYRISLYFYNTIDECSFFLDKLHNIFEERCYI